MYNNMETFRQRLEIYNRIPRTLREIYESLGDVCPFVAKFSTQDESFAILVTRLQEGVAYGFPLRNRKRIRTNWYNGQGSVPVPSQNNPGWSLIDAPYDNLEDIFQQMSYQRQIKGEMTDEEKELLSTYEENSSLGIVPVGKYRGKSVEFVFQNDPAYAAWAAENVPAFQDLIYESICKTARNIAR